MNKPRPLDPIHPGEILLEEFLKPLGMTAYAAAKVMGVPRTRLERLMRHEASVTPDTALRLERAFGSSAEMWMGLQADYDLELARAANDASLSAIRRVIAAE
jgi:addiction module HigA family antidote